MDGWMDTHIYIYTHTNTHACTERECTYVYMYYLVYSMYYLHIVSPKYYCDSRFCPSKGGPCRSTYNETRLQHAES